MAATPEQAAAITKMEADIKKLQQALEQLARDVGVELTSSVPPAPVFTPPPFYIPPFVK